MSAPTILIIDDDPDFVEITKAILETKQYNVSFANDPEEGYAKMEEEMPDAIILDVMMGRGAGAPGAKEQPQQPPSPQQPQQQPRQRR